MLMNALPPACSIEGALSYIVNHLAEISQLAAQTDRLDALLTTLVAQQEGVPGGVLRWGGAAAARLPATPSLLYLHVCVVRRVLCTFPSMHACQLVSVPAGADGARLCRSRPVAGSPAATAVWYWRS